MMQQSCPKLRYRKDLWGDSGTPSLDEPEGLRYHSNLLEADLRITNFCGHPFKGEAAGRCGKVRS